MLASAALLPEHAERRGCRGAVQRDEPAPGEQHLAAAGQLHAGAGLREAGGQPVGGAEAVARRDHPAGAAGQRGDRAGVGARVGAAHQDRGGAGGLGGGGDGLVARVHVGLDEHPDPGRGGR